MSRTILALLVGTTLFASTSAYADHTYKVYKTNPWGRKSIVDGPTAIIEFDDMTGDMKVYEPNLLGQPDRIKGPSYIIEADSLHGHNFHNDYSHHHPYDRNPFGNTHDHEHRFEQHDEGDECDDH